MHSSQEEPQELQEQSPSQPSPRESFKASGDGTYMIPFWFHPAFCRNLERTPAEQHEAIWETIHGQIDHFEDSYLAQKDSERGGATHAAST